MRRRYVWVCILLALSARGEVKHIRGKVTYVASGTVYTSLGRESGVQDSTLLFVVSGSDTTALKVFAVSSKSSACRVLHGTRSTGIGDEVFGTIEIVETIRPATDTIRTADQPSRVPLPNPRALPPVSVQENILSVRGRLSAQYFASLYDNTLFNSSQPGVVVNLRGTLRDIPLKFDVYANVRTLSVGNKSPFSGGAINQTRVYGLSVSYDDGENVLSFGRIIPVFSPSIGYIDGALVSKAFGNLTAGVTVGYQPAFNLRSISTDYRKVAVFAQYRTPDRIALSVSTAYARTYFRSALDREVTSVLMNASLASNLFLYANTEIDLRRKSGSNFILSPKLTGANVHLNYRIIRPVSVGIGADASRPYYSFETVRHIPDSLLRNDVRSGVSISVNILLPGGISLFNTYTPRSSEHASFGRDYSNYSAINISDVLSSGIGIRTTMNVNANQFTRGTGYGVSIQKTFAQLLDIILRAHRNGYTVKQTDVRSSSSTLGVDVIVFLTRELNFVASYDRLSGYGTVSNSVFAELSVRL
ncbi:MAG: hypothetical protein KF749_06555 [Bacteroidetes bacterium]|nr:hypothetical protein [Bacteroidota bacterium]MCW5896893.1 hypothetical protein [Bacteroidota bacterium]